jgi:cell wall-associated NlpC family hydrolase
MASQAPAYAALLLGGVGLVSAVKGAKLRDVLAGADVPIRPLTTGIPSEFSSGSSGGGGTSDTALTAFHGVAVAAGAKGAVQWAEAKIGTREGSGAESRWAQAAGISPTTAWCSAFVAAVLRASGVKNLPANPAYSGAWLSWKGGTNLHTTSLRQARPGDLLIFDWGDGGITDHVGIYTGRGQYVAGNNSDNSVGKAPVPTGNIVGIVRPKYPVPSMQGRLFQTASGVV